MKFDQRQSIQPQNDGYAATSIALIARQTFSEVAGISISGPSTLERASLTALITAGSEPHVPVFAGVPPDILFFPAFAVSYLADEHIIFVWGES